MQGKKLFARLDHLNSEVSALVERIRYFYWDVVQLITWGDVSNCVLHKHGKYKEAMLRNGCSADNKTNDYTTLIFVHAKSAEIFILRKTGKIHLFHSSTVARLSDE